MLTVSWLNAASASAIASAAATILLALFTWRLAVQTRSLATQTAADVAAQRRPVIVAADFAEVSLDRASWAFGVTLLNFGHGPPLAAELYLNDHPTPSLFGGPLAVAGRATVRLQQSFDTGWLWTLPSILIGIVVRYHGIAEQSHHTQLEFLVDGPFHPGDVHRLSVTRTRCEPRPATRATAAAAAARPRIQPGRRPRDLARRCP